MFENIETKKYYKPISDITPIAMIFIKRVNFLFTVIMIFGNKVKIAVVTGAAGFIGINLVTRLLNNDWYVMQLMLVLMLVI